MPKIFRTLLMAPVLLLVPIVGDQPQRPFAAALAPAETLSEPGLSISEPGLSIDQIGALCFAPGTSAEVIESLYRTFDLSGTGFADGPEGSGGSRFQFGSRWGTTATNGGGLQRGDPTILTWSIVPDGTMINGLIEPSGPSNLRAWLNGIYGNQTVWQPHFQAAFDRWSQVTGVTYVYEPNDDGQIISNSSQVAPGILGVRGDLRISGHTIDGNFNVLAYNYFPNNGEMVIDTADSFFNNLSNGSRALRNVIMHEHGHGLGVSHVCPINQTKLMEPNASLAFEGPQHDDILTTNRLYGDPLEPNDSRAAATNLGQISEGGFTFDGMSIDGSSDVDFYRLTLSTTLELEATLVPTGGTYLEGPQVGLSCSPGTNFNSLSLNNLGIELLNQDGSVSIELANANGAGLTETIGPVQLDPGTYYLRVFRSGPDQVQLYELDLMGTEIAGVCTYGEVLAAWRTEILTCLGANISVRDLVFGLENGTLLP